MVSQTTVTLVDDVDGTEAASTVQFGLQGASYEIDLSEDNMQILVDRLQPFIDHARPVSRQRRNGAASNGRHQSSETNRLIRQWARENGIEVSDRGRIPSDVLEAYEAR